MFLNWPKWRLCIFCSFFFFFLSVNQLKWCRRTPTSGDPLTLSGAVCQRDKCQTGGAVTRQFEEKLRKTKISATQMDIKSTSLESCPFLVATKGNLTARILTYTGYWAVSVEMNNWRGGGGVSAFSCLYHCSSQRGGGWQHLPVHSIAQHTRAALASQRVNDSRTLWYFFFYIQRFLVFTTRTRHMMRMWCVWRSCASLRSKG